MAFSFPKGAGQPPRSFQTDDEFLSFLKTVIAQHAGSPRFGVSELAQRCGMHPSSLKRVLQRAQGTTPGHLIRQHRLQHGLQLLRQGHHSVKEIAYAVGFQHPDAFSKAFKTNFSLSPEGFRQEHFPNTGSGFTLSVPITEARPEDWDKLLAAHPWLGELFRLLRKHFPDEGITQEFLAHGLSISTVQLNRQFNRVLGMAPIRFVRVLRLEYAAYLLLTTDFSIRRIAVEAGFSDSPHFCRLFRKHYGHTPGAHRKATAGVSANTFFQQFFRELF